MAQKQNRRAKIVGTDIELDISEKEEVIVEPESEEADEATDAEEQPADEEAQEESSEEAKDDAGEEE